MALLAVLDENAHGGLDESLKTLYKQSSEGQYVLDLAPDEAEKLAVNLNTKFNNKKTELDRVHNEKKDVAAKLAEFEKLGKTADEIKQLIDSKRPEEITKLVADYDTKLEQLKASALEASTQDKALIESLKGQLANTLTRTEIQRLRNQHDLDETAEFVLEKFIRSEPKDENSTEFVTRVYGADGQPALHALEPMTPDQLIQSFREGKKFPSMFKVSDGAGAGVTNRSAMGNGSKQYEGLSAVEKLNLARANGVKT